MPDDVARALACARRYRELGLSPLPSRRDAKRPDLESFAEFWGRPLPASLFEPDTWRATNIQIMTGAKTGSSVKILVVDCDGEEAIARWKAILGRHGHDADRSWVAVTGSGGLHTYFLLPDGIDACPSGMIWGLWDTWGDDGKGRWAKHKEIRILGDNALVVAPPSIHVETGRRYEFAGLSSPRRVPLPEPAPDWLLAMPRLSAPRFGEPPKADPPRPTAYRPTGNSYSRAEVIAAIPNKVALAAEWGLKFARAEPNQNRWVPCHAIGRDDRTPSASFHADDGTYQDRKDLRSISLFDLGVELRRFADWKDCLNWCGDRFVGRRSNSNAYMGNWAT